MDKYPSTFLCHMKAIVVIILQTSPVLKIEEYYGTRIFPSLSWGIFCFSHLIHLDQSHTIQNIWWIRTLCTITKLVYGCRISLTIFSLCPSQEPIASFWKYLQYKQLVCSNQILFSSLIFFCIFFRDSAIAACSSWSLACLSMASC